jgi:hypothetical protein
MIIAMTIMWVMQPSVYEVINVITVRHAFVSAVRPMRVFAPGTRRAARGVGVADFNNMLVDMIPMHVMQMTIVEIIDMTTMAYSGVSTTRTMLMSVFRVMLLVARFHVLLVTFGVSGKLRSFDAVRLRDCLGHAGRAGRPAFGTPRTISITW